MKPVGGWTRTAIHILLLAALFAGAMGATLSYDVDLTFEKRRRSHGERAYTPAYRPLAGPQIEMVYFGSSLCPSSNRSELPAAIERIKRRLAGSARAHGMSFRAVGLALDWDTDRGIRHLREFGSFDEISAGYNWGNSMALQQLWSEDIAPSTPRIHIYYRHVIVPQDSTDLLYYGERDRLLLYSRSGFDEITAWAETQGPLLDPQQLSLAETRAAELQP